MAMIAASGGIGTIIGPVFGGLLAEVSPLFPMYAAAGLALFAAALAGKRLTEPQRHVGMGQTVKLKFYDPRIFPYLLGWFVVFMVFTGIQMVSVFFIQDRIGIEGQQQIIRTTSIALFCMAIVTVIVQVLVMQVWKISPKLMLRSSFLMFAAVLVLLSSVTNVYMLFVTFGLMGLSVSLAMPGLNTAATLAIEPHEQGAAAGLLTAAPTLGMIFGPFLGAVLYEMSATWPMLAGAVCSALVGVYFFFVTIPDPQSEAKA
jgi:MFS family permease